MRQVVLCVQIALAGAIGLSVASPVGNDWSPSIRPKRNGATR